MEIVSIGELLVEIMRSKVGVPLSKPGEFLGPYPSGAPAIFIDAAARLGHSCAFAGAVGKDEFGKCLLDRLEADGVDTTRILCLADYTTGIAFVTYFADGSRQFLFHIAYAAAGQVAEIDIDSLASAIFLHICGSSLAVNETMRNACYRACEVVKAAGGKISFDPNLRPELVSEEQFQEICRPVLERSYVVLPGEREVELLAGVAGPENACRVLLEKGPSIVGLKRGARGCAVFEHDSSFDVPPFPTQVVDPTGAGDCFDAGFVVGLLEEMPIKRVALLANAMGALGTSRMGPMEGAYFRSDVFRFMEVHHAI